MCGDVRDLHKHHIFEGPNRKMSEKYGLWVYLCAKHHNFSSEGVHFNKMLDNFLKREAKRFFLKEHTEEEFMQAFGRKNAVIGDE